MPKPIGALKHMDQAVLRDRVQQADGWTIWDPKGLKDQGFPSKWVDSVTHFYRSDGTPKGSIEDLSTGQMVDGMTGVYALNFLWAVAHDIGADTKNCTANGRGFLARKVQEAIHQVLKVDGEPTDGPPSTGADRAS